MNLKHSPQTIRHKAFKVIEENPGLSATEVRDRLKEENVSETLIALTRLKKLTRQRIKRPPAPYKGIWIYFINPQYQTKS